MKTVFDDVKVVGFTYAGTGNAVMQSLGTYGATVVRVESMNRPCNLRTAAPFKDGKPGINRSLFYALVNSDCYSLALNLKHPKSRQTLDRLCRWADVAIENFTPGTMDKLGLGYEAMKSLNPDIIMLSISSQGQTGPHHYLPSYGPQLQALTGHVNLCGWPDRPPCQVDTAYPDWIVPAYASIALIAALDYRRRTGKGQYIDASNVEPTVHWIAPVLLDYAANGNIQTRNGNRVPHAAPHNAYPCKGQDSWCVIAVTSDGEWDSFCKVIGRVELGRNPKFATLISRKRNEAELDQIVGAWTINVTAEEVVERMQSAKVPAGKVQSWKELFEDPQLSHRGFFHTLQHSEIGSYKAITSSPCLLSRTPDALRLPAPCLGEHTEYVCTQLLNMPDEEFLELLADNVFE